MKTPKKNLFLYLSFIVMISMSILSCKKPIRGCTDPSSRNYNPEATAEDHSCTYYFYDKEVGRVLISNGSNEANAHPFIIGPDYEYYFNEIKEFSSSSNIGESPCELNGKESINIKAGTYTFKAVHKRKPETRETTINVLAQKCIDIDIFSLPIKISCPIGVWYKEATCTSNPNPPNSIWEFRPDGTGYSSNPDCTGICTPLIFNITYKINGNKIEYEFTEPEFVECDGYAPSKPNRPTGKYSITYSCSSNGQELTIETTGGVQTFTRL
jgi:hypothetical protein